MITALAVNRCLLPRRWGNIDLPHRLRVSTSPPPGRPTGKAMIARLGLFLLVVFLLLVFSAPLLAMQHTPAPGELIAIDVPLDALPIIERLGIIHQKEPRLSYWRSAATLSQFMQLKGEGVIFRAVGHVTIVQGKSYGETNSASLLAPFECFNSTHTDLPIPLNTDWGYSPIWTSCTEATGGTVTNVDIYYEVIHPWADNAVWLNLGSSSPSWF